MIATYAKKISDANVTCSTAEIELLKTEVTSLESAIVSVNVVLTAIQEQIKSNLSALPPLARYLALAQILTTLREFSSLGN